MVLVTKELFIKTIETIRLQLEKDKENSQAISKAFNISDDVVFTYDNSPLIKMLVMLLQISFPKKGDHCEIEHFMFDMNFGKVGDQELVTIDDLWFRLNEQKLIDVTEYQHQYCSKTNSDQFKNLETFQKNEGKHFESIEPYAYDQIDWSKKTFKK